MALSAGQRMAAHRQRRKQAGLVNVAIEVPAEHAAEFRVQARALVLRLSGTDAAGAAWLAGRATAEPRAARALADAITRDISALGWPVGRVIADEAGLLRRYRVGRGTLREAVRLLEHDNVARMKRGPRGGLVVDCPNLASTVHGARIFLEYSRIDPDHFLGLRAMLESAAIDKVIERLNENGRERISCAIAQEQELVQPTPKDYMQFNMLLAELSGDPALLLFIGILMELTLQRADGTAMSERQSVEMSKRIGICHVEIAASLLAGDGARAKAVLQDMLQVTRAARFRASG